MSITPQEVDLAYQFFVNRTPAEEERAWMVENHDSLQSLRNAFLTSSEFEQKYSHFQVQLSTQQTPTLIHLHIPKTAGTSLIQALQKEPQLQPHMLVHDGEGVDRLAAMPRAQRRALRYVHGHLSSSVGDAFDLPYRYLCVIRRPGQRIFSFYQFIRRTTDHPSFALLTDNDMSFGDFLEYSVDSMDHRLELDNGQIRRLGGNSFPSGLGHESQLLRVALHTALSPRMIFGFVEHFPLLVRSLVDEGFLTDPDIESFNVSPNADAYDQAVAELTEDQHMIFESYTAWDRYFYDVCETLLLPQTED